MAFRIYEDPIGKGMAIRAEQALPHAERPAAFRAVAEQVVAVYRAALAEGKDLRSIGGWSTLIKAAIGPRPDPKPNEIQMPTSEAYWRWQVLDGSTMEIRNAAIELFNGWSHS